VALNQMVRGHADQPEHPACCFERASVRTPLWEMAKFSRRQQHRRLN